MKDGPCEFTCNSGLMCKQTNTLSHVRYMAGCVKVKWTPQLMGWWMVYCEVITTVMFAMGPE